MAGRGSAVFALVAHEEPFPGLRFFKKSINRSRSRTINCILFRESFYELYVAPIICGKVAGVVVTITGPMIRIRLQLIPLLAGYFAGFASGTDRSISKKSQFLTLRERIISIKQAVDRINLVILLRLIGRIFLFDDVKDVFGIDGFHI